MDGWMDDRWKEFSSQNDGGWRDGWRDGRWRDGWWMERWMERWMVDGEMDGWVVDGGMLARWLLVSQTSLFPWPWLWDLGFGGLSPGSPAPHPREERRGLTEATACQPPSVHGEASPRMGQTPRLPELALAICGQKVFPPWAAGVGLHLSFGALWHAQPSLCSPTRATTFRRSQRWGHGANSLQGNGPEDVFGRRPPHTPLSGSQSGFPCGQHLPPLSWLPVRDSQRNSVQVPQAMAACSERS